MGNSASQPISPESPIQILTEQTDSSLIGKSTILRMDVQANICDQNGTVSWESFKKEMDPSSEYPSFISLLWTLLNNTIAYPSGPSQVNMVFEKFLSSLQMIINYNEEMLPIEHSQTLISGLTQESDQSQISKTELYELILGLLDRVTKEKFEVGELTESMVNSLIRDNVKLDVDDLAYTINALLPNWKDWIVFTFIDKLINPNLTDINYQKPGQLEYPSFDSLITQPQLSLLNLILPNLSGSILPDVLFDSFSNGLSIRMLEKNVAKYPKPILLLLHALDDQGQQSISVIYMPTQLRLSTQLTGTTDLKLITIQPEFRVYKPIRSEHTLFNLQTGLKLGKPALLTISPNLSSLTIDPSQNLAHKPSFQSIPTIDRTLPIHSPKTYQLEQIQILGLGDDIARKDQSKAWKFESDEANRRANPQFVKGDEQSRLVLEQAGIIQPKEDLLSYKATQP